MRTRLFIDGQNIFVSSDGWSGTNQFIASEKIEPISGYFSADDIKDAIYTTEQRVQAKIAQSRISKESRKA